MSSASVASNEMSVNPANMMNMGFQPIPGMLSPTPMMGGMMSPPPMLMPTPIQGGMALATGQGKDVETLLLLFHRHYAITKPKTKTIIHNFYNTSWGK